ncbi:MAG: helical backbone metal receptor [Gemmatimonadetes bacterium]|nr:helical backbone metal receptor [Gemmatimonadota bacterium]
MFFSPRTKLLYIATAIGATACNTPEVGGGGVVDDVGRTVTLEAPARRVVSLLPPITELLFAIGAESTVVGRTQWDKYPPSVVDVPIVGDAFSPNVERVVAQRPDLVAMYASSANEQAIQRLADLGIPTVSIRMDSLASVVRGANLLGRLTGTTRRADSLVRIFEAERDSTLNAPRPDLAVRVVILSWDNPPIIIGARSFLSELVTLAGGDNVFSDVDAPSAPVSIESITVRDPDLIVMLGDDAPTFADRPEWQTVAAVRNRRFVFLQGSEFEYPSFRAFAAVRKLRSMLMEAVQ